MVLANIRAGGLANPDVIGRGAMKALSLDMFRTSSPADFWQQLTQTHLEGVFLSLAPGQDSVDVTDGVVAMLGRSSVTSLHLGAGTQADLSVILRALELNSVLKAFRFGGQGTPPGPRVLVSVLQKNTTLSEYFVPGKDDMGRFLLQLNGQGRVVILEGDSLLLTQQISLIESQEWDNKHTKFEAVFTLLLANPTAICKKPQPASDSE